MSRPARLTPSQKTALEELENGSGHIFLTGSPGTGKSFLIERFIQKHRQDIPVVASTGAAAILVGGSTFHSFFGLGIMQGNPHAILERALENGRLRKRIRDTDTLVVDEISMLSAEALDCAEAIARRVRKSEAAWGGVRMIVVGDFAQLPPISRNGAKKWGFQSQAWKRSRFRVLELREVVRTEDAEFLNVLEDLRWGMVTERAARFLEERVVNPEEVEVDVPHVFPRRAQTEAYNRMKLEEIAFPVRKFETEYGGEDRFVRMLMKDAPVPPVLELKENALVMIRVNDPRQRYVNGTVGRIVEIDEDYLLVESGKRSFELQPFTFTVFDEEGEEAAYAINFPVTLAYANTIHKVQGATLEQLHVSLKALWEPGQAYVALSRARSGRGVTLMGWDAASIMADPAVRDFYEKKDAEKPAVSEIISLNES